MSAYKLLSEPIRKYISVKKWEELRPIQSAAIKGIIENDNHYILASRTASGKTEAAFLPILSKANFESNSVQILYISPLIALINDQFIRVEELCELLEVPVTKWHGEAKKSRKNKLVKRPAGVVLITPESIEAMFINNPANIKHLFGQLQYIVIDEIHSFLGRDRGIQLMSLLYRLSEKSSIRTVCVGLSATIGKENFYWVKKFMGDVEHTTILLDDKKKDTQASFRYFEQEGTELTLDLLKDLYRETASSKVLVFPNSRGKTEEVAVKLNKLSERTNGHGRYFTHHSSVDKGIREDIERFAKENKRFNFCISCTSTLELGIDIGSVDKVIQIDSTHSVSSLVQRVGRSGRLQGKSSNLILYATEPWSLLQSLACWSLYQKAFFEPSPIREKPYDVFFHQLMSVAKERAGISKNKLVFLLAGNPSFQAIPAKEMEEIIDYSIEQDYLEIVDREIIVGFTGEEIINKRDFYSLFTSESNFKVTHEGRKLGQIPYSPQVQIDQNMLLAAKIWKIIDIDFQSERIMVVPAKDGKKPMFFGGVADIHEEVRYEMLSILYSGEEHEYLDKAGGITISKLRNEIADTVPLNDTTAQRPCIDDGKITTVYTFSSSKVNRTLVFLYKCLKIEVIANERNSSIEVPMLFLEFLKSIDKVNAVAEDLDSYLAEFIRDSEGFLGNSKFGLFLPLKYQIRILRENFFAFEEAIDLLDHHEFVKAGQ